MNVNDFVNLSNELYDKLFGDFKFSPSYADWIDPKLEYIPLVHELSHAIISAFGGPDNNYTFCENLATSIEAGLLQSLGLADRHMDEFFIEPKSPFLSSISYKTVFRHSFPDLKKRYPASVHLENASRVVKGIYGHIAVDLLQYLTGELILELIELGRQVATLLKERKCMDITLFPVDKDYYLNYYPLNSDLENTNALLKNEAELRRALSETSIVELYEIVHEVASQIPELTAKIKILQAIFTHVVLGYSSEFCETHFELKHGYPKEWTLWNRNSNGEISFDVATAKDLLKKYFPEFIF